MSALTPISTAELKAWLENLPYSTELEQYPLTRELYETEFVQRFLRQSPQPDTTPAGRAVCLALRDFWRMAFMQRNYSPRLKRIWNTFFILEVAYFYPAAVTSVFPGSLNELGALLCDREYLALLVTDGNQEQAKRIAAENTDFWEAIIPYEEVPSPQTISSRRDAAIEKLTKELNRQFELVRPTANQLTPALLIPGGQSTALSETHTLLPVLEEVDNSIYTTLSYPVPPHQLPETTSPSQSSIVQQYQERAYSRRWRNALDIPLFAWPQGDEVSVSDLDMVAASIDIGELMTTLGVRSIPDDGEAWKTDRGILTALLARFTARGDDDIRLQCAACLRYVQLSPVIEVEVRAGFKAWGIKPVSALESIARLALDRRADDFTRSLAEAILTQETHVEQLWNLNKCYVPLAHKLTFNLGKHLYFDDRLSRLKLY